MTLHTPAPATPVVRSAALERRLRRRRQEARIRARLASDGAILLAHHACTPPSAPLAQPRALAQLREQLEALQVRFNELLAFVEALDNAKVRHNNTLEERVLHMYLKKRCLMMR